ncbi:hypothetical protein ACFV1G_35495, partial [Streptomyces anulatus]
DPIGFLGNLVKAVGAGLNLFITNIADHLKTGVVSWLLGTAVKAGLDLPARFDLKGIIQLIGSMLGLTWDNIRTRVTRKGVPDEAMSAVETSVPVAKNLAAEGPAGAVKEIQAEAGDLKATILGKLTTYLIPTVLIAGITWIISLLNPASAFVRAVKGIIDIVTFIVTQGAQIADFVNAVLDAVIAIANGGQAGVPKLIEAALASSVPLLIGFLAALLGIGGLANKVKSVFQSVSRPVTRAIDKIVDFIAKKGKALWDKLKKNGKEGAAPAVDNKKNPGGKPKGRDGEQQKKPIRFAFAMQGEPHRLTLTRSGRLLMASSREQALLAKIEAAMGSVSDQDQIESLSNLWRLTSALLGRGENATQEQVREHARELEKYGDQYGKDDIAPESDEPGRPNRTPVERPAKKDRKSTPRLLKLADEHRGAGCVAILTVDSRTYEGWSAGRPESDLDSQALSDIRSHSPAHTLGCAEVHCISQAYGKEYKKNVNELPVEFTAIEMVHADRYEKPNSWYQKPFPACSHCSPMLEGLKITTMN